MLSRRAFVAGVSVTLLASTAACEGESASPSPSERTEAEAQQRDADLLDSTVLAATLQRTAELRALAPRPSKPVGTGSRAEPLADVIRVLGIQQAVLDRMVRAVHPQLADVARDAAETTSLPLAEFADLIADSSISDPIQLELQEVSAANVPTLMALHGQRAAAAVALGHEVAWPVLVGPTGAGAITILAGLRQAVYGFEVLVSRTDAQERERHADTLTSLRRHTRTVTELAGFAAPAPPLGYGLPSALTSARARSRFAQDLIVALTEAVVAGSSARAGDPKAIAGTIFLMAQAVRLGSDVGVSSSGFPGMSVPATLE